MLDGISGKPVPYIFPAAGLFNSESLARGFWPCLTAAVALRETLCAYSFSQACVIISPDGGHGLMQLTSLVPTDWSTPARNIAFALDHYLMPIAARFAAVPGLTGDALVRLIADGYNEGPDTAWRYHLEGNADLGSTDNYGAAVLAFYTNLVNDGEPQWHQTP